MPIWRKTGRPSTTTIAQAFFKVLDAQAAAHDGYIPPALDGQKGGYDWGNMLAVVPEPTLDPHDPRVTATLKATQAKYAEGIMTYANGEYLHHYLTIKNTMTETIRGDQQQAVSEFYALLVHTSSTHAGFEFAIRPWGDRNFRRQPCAAWLVRGGVSHAAAHHAGARRGQAAASAERGFAGVDREGQDDRGEPGADVLRHRCFRARAAAGWRGDAEAEYAVHLQRPGRCSCTCRGASICDRRPPMASPFNPPMARFRFPLPREPLNFTGA